MSAVPEYAELRAAWPAARPLAPEKAVALLQMLRGHWARDGRLHGVPGVTANEIALASELALRARVANGRLLVIAANAELAAHSGLSRRKVEDALARLQLSEPGHPALVTLVKNRRSERVIVLEWFNVVQPDVLPNPRATQRLRTAAEQRQRVAHLRVVGEERAAGEAPRPTRPPATLADVPNEMPASTSIEARLAWWNLREQAVAACATAGVAVPERWLQEQSAALAELFAQAKTGREFSELDLQYAIENTLRAGIAAKVAQDPGRAQIGAYIRAAALRMAEDYRARQVGELLPANHALRERWEWLESEILFADPGGSARRALEAQRTTLVEQLEAELGITS